MPVEDLGPFEIGRMAGIGNMSNRGARQQRGKRIGGKGRHDNILVPRKQESWAENGAELGGGTRAGGEEPGPQGLLIKLGIDLIDVAIEQM